MAAGLISISQKEGGAAAFRAPFDRAASGEGVHADVYGQTVSPALGAGAASFAVAPAVRQIIQLCSVIGKAGRSALRERRKYRKTHI